MAADGQVTITLDLEDNLSSELTKAIESSKSAGNKIEASAKESNNVIRQEAKKTREELNQQFGKETRIKLVTEFDKAGVKNFDEILEQLPKKKQVELLTKADKGELIDVEKEIKKLPPVVKSKVELNDDASPKLEKIRTLSKKEIRQKIVADADTQGIKNFGKLLKKLPEKTRTDLMARAEKGEVINYEKLLHKIPAKIVSKAELNDNASSGIHKITSESKDLQKQANNTGHSFSRLKDIMIGSFVGSAITSGIFGIQNGLREATKAGMEYDKVQDTMKTNWKALTTEAPKDGKQMIGFVNDLSQHSIYSADSIDKMAQSFYHINSNAPDAKKWSQDFVNLGSTLHVSNDALRESGEQFSKIVAGGKASQEDMNVMINRFPMFGEALEKASGKSMKQLQEMSSQGKLTATQFTDALDYLGKKYKDSQEEALNSAQGMGMYLSSRFSKLSGDIMKSSFNMSKSTLEAIKEVTSDKSMEAYSKSISSAIGSMTTALSHFIEYIAKHKKDIVSIFGSIKDIAGALVGGAWDTAKTTVSFIADAFSSLGGNAKKTKDPLKNLDSVLKDIAKHKDALKTLGGVLAAAFAVKKLAEFADGIRKVNDSLKITGGMKKIGGLFIKPKVDGSDAKRELGILGKAAKSTGSGIKSALKWTAKVSTKAAIVALNGLKKAAQVTGAGMKAAFNFAKANPILLIISAIVALGVAFYELYKHNAKFRKFVDGIAKNISGFFKSAGKVIDKGIKSIQKAFKGVMNFFKKDWKEILLFIVNPFSGAFALLYKHNKKFRNGVDSVIKWFKNVFKSFGKWLDKTWHSIWEPIKDFFGDVFKFFKKVWDTWYKGFTHNMSAFGKWLSKTWHSIWNPIKDFFSDIWNDIKKIGKKAWDWISDHISGFGKIVSKIWNGLWNGISSFFGGIWDAIKKTASNSFNWIADKLDGFGEGISKGWHKLWSGVSDFFGDIWDGIKKTAKDGINGVIGFINDGIGGINSVIHTFGGKKNAIGKIHKFATGTKGAPSGLAMVNDGNGEELIIDSQGTPHILEGRNRLVAFSGGETVVPHEETKAIFGGSMPKFAKGTPNWLEGVTDWVKDKWDSLKNFIKHPLKAVGGIMNNAIKGVASHTPEFVKEFTPPLANTFVKSIISPITSLFKKLDSKHEEEISSKDIGAGGNWRSQIEKAAKEAHVSLGSGDMSAIMARINKESGGHQNIKQQIHDINSVNGNPAQGLLQYIPPTFKSWAVAGHTNILSGYDQLMAMFNDSNWASDIRMPGGWGPTGHRRFANGGWANKPSIFGEVAGEPEVAINPSRPSADKLLLEASLETAKKQPNSLMAKVIMQADIAKSSLQSGHNINQPLASGSATLQNGNVKDAKNGDLIVEFNIDGQQMGRVISPIIESIHDQKTTIEANTMGLGGTLNYGR